MGILFAGQTLREALNGRTVQVVSSDPDHQDKTVIQDLKAALRAQGCRLEDMKN